MKEGQPSFTALGVAYFVIILGQTNCSLLPPGIVPLQMALLEAVGLPFKHYWFLWLLRTPLGPIVSRILRFVGNFICKDGLECVAFRKSVIDQQVRQFLHAHKTSNPQVLVLGSGYDTLSLRLAKEYSSTHFWEIDHPATGDFKNSMWQRQSATKNQGPLRVIGEKPGNLFHASADLTKKNALVNTLGARESYDVSRPTIVVSEGLLMYLSRDQVYQVFDEISKSVGAGSMAVFDMLATTYDQEGNQKPNVGPITPLLDLVLRFKSEPLLLGLDEKILKEFIVESNWLWSMKSDIQGLGPARVVSLQLHKK